MAHKLHFSEQTDKRKEHFMMSMETEAVIMQLLGASPEVMEELLDFQ